MPNEQRLNGIKPAAGDHAIVLASIGFEWGEPLSAQLIGLLIAKHESVKHMLPRRQEIQQSIVVEAGVDAPDAQSAKQNEPIFAALIMDEPGNEERSAKQLRILPKSLVYNDFRHYGGWTEFRREAIEIVTPFLDLIRQKHSVGVAGLQYIDAFSVDNPSRVAAEVFQRGKLLPEHVFLREDIWHVHQGYFEATDEPLPHKRLTNVDISVVREEDGAKLQIKCLHRAFFDPDEAPYVHERLGELHDSLHDDNKRVLEDILTIGVQEMIGLRKRGA